MPVSEVLPYFARGFSNRSAIKHLLELECQEVDMALAMNPYLTTSEIDAILARSTSLTKTLLASRIDLTTAQSIELVKSQDPLVITSLLTSQNVSRPKFADEVIKELLGPGWISVSYVTSISELMSEGSIYKAELLKKGISTENSVSLRSQRRRSILKLQRTLQEGHFREYVQVTAPDQSNRIDRYKDGRSVDPLKLTLTALMLKGELAVAIPAVTTCKSITDLTSDPGDEFFSILFSLAPDWNLTLGELVSSVLSLASRPQEITRGEKDALPGRCTPHLS